MDPDKGKPVFLYILGIHLPIAFRNLLLDVLHLYQNPDHIHILCDDPFLLSFVVSEFIQFVFFLVVFIRVKMIQGKPFSSVLINSAICIFLDMLFLISMIYKLNFGYEAANRNHHVVFQVTHWCLIQILFDIFSEYIIYRIYNAKSPSPEQDVHCEEGNVPASALNDVHSTRTHPQYPVQPEGNISAPTLNAPQSDLIHPQYPVQPKGILGPSPESGIPSYRDTS